MILKLKKNSSIKENGLYDLEEIFGDSDGHGCGFGEDISWYLTDHRKDPYTRLDISQEKENELKVCLSEVYDDADNKELSINDMPKNWKKKFDEFKKIHCTK